MRAQISFGFRIALFWFCLEVPRKACEKESGRGLRPGIDLSSIDIWAWILLCPESFFLCIIKHLASSLAFTHQMTVAPSQLDHFLSLSACWLSLSFIKATRAIKGLDALLFSKHYLHLSAHFNPLPSGRESLFTACIPSWIHWIMLCPLQDTKIILLHYCPSIIHPRS